MKFKSKKFKRYFFFFAALLISFRIEAATDVSPLDQALNIVFTNNEIISQYHLMKQSLMSGNNWTSSIKLSTGYAEQTTNDYASGFDARAGLTVEIPLGANPLDKEKANIILALSKAELDLKERFLNEIESLTVLQMELRTAIELHNFYVDKVQYFKQGISTGVTQEIDLWTQSETALKQQHNASIASSKYKAQLESTARTYGGQSWKELLDLITQHMKTPDKPN